MSYKEPRFVITRYVVGFLGSLLTTFIAYYLVTHHLMHGTTLLLILGGLALAQMALQLVFFLHLGTDVWSKVRQASLGFMFIILLILVIGSIWIMENMNYNMMNMSPQQKDDYMTVEKDKGF